MEKICVYTCITGDYDDLIELTIKDADVDYFCFTNNKNLKSNTWNIIQIENERYDNHMLSRKIKMLGHPLLEQYKVHVWIDANVEIRKSIKDFLNSQCDLNKYDFVAFQHEERDCIYDEAISCVKLRKEKKEIVHKQVQFYNQEGFPHHYGLGEMSVFVKRNCQEANQTMDFWFQMIQKYSKRDQLSFMYAAYKTQLKLQLLPIPVKNNEWFFRRDGHKNNATIKEYRLYFGDSANFEMNRVEDGVFQIQNNSYVIKTKILADCDMIEFSITKQLGICLSELKINLPTTEIKYFNGFYYENEILFDGECCCNIYGDFHQGELLEIELKICKMTEAFYLSVIRKQHNDNICLNQQLEHLSKQYHSVVSSKGWRILEKMRSLFRR